jgi:GNAT superfamily N-acetyltransferase
MTLLTAQIEPLTATLEELKPWFPMHWEELGIFRDRMPLDPSYGLYLARDAAGEVVLATARRDSRLIGYAVFFLARGLHYRQTLTAHMDICYILPEERMAGAGEALFAEAERELRRRGVQMWWCGSKNHKPIVDFFLRQGFTAEEVHVAKWLGGEPNA